MKIHRPVASLLFAFVFGLAAFAEDSSEIAALRAKAMKGNGVAQYNLGLAYAEGHGLPVDPLEAFVWLSLARENGARGRALDTLVASFDKATFAAAEQRLAEHKADPANKTSSVRIARTESPAAVKPTADFKPAPVPVTKPAADAPVVAPSQPATPAEDPALTRLRAERDALAVKVNGLANELAALRSDHELLVRQSAGNDKAALEKKTREWQAALADLESARNFGRQVEATLNKVNDQKTALATQLAAASAEASHTREEAAALRTAQSELTTRVAAAGSADATSAAAIASLQQKLAAAEQQLAELGSTKASLDQSRGNLAASEKQTMALTARVAELERAASRTGGETVQKHLEEATTQLAALTKTKEDVQQQLTAATTERTALQSELAQLRQKPATPKYPDLSGRVHELEATLADTQRQLAAKPAAPAYPDLSSKVGELENQLAKARKPAPPAYPDLRPNVAAFEAKLATAATEASHAKQEMAVLAKANTEAQQALAAKPSYPDLSGKVSELDHQLAEARKPVPPAYPDLSGRVHELENLAAASSVATAASAQELADARTRLAASATEAGEMKQQVTALTAAKTESMQKLEAAGVERASLQSELTQLRAKTATPAYPDLAPRVSELEAQLAAASKPAAPVYPDLSGRVQELGSALGDTNRQLIAAQNAAAKAVASSHPDLSGRVSELEAALAAATQKAGATELARAELAKQFDDYKSATLAAQRDHARMQTETKMLESDKVALHRQVDAATTEAGQLRTQVAALKTQLATIKPAVAVSPDLSGKVADLKKELDDGRGKLAASEQHATTLTARVAELEQAAGQQNAQLTSSTTASETAQKRVTEITAELAAVQQQLGAATTERSTLQAEVGQLRQKAAAPAYPDLSGKVGELESQLAKAREPAPPAYPDLRSNVAAFEAQLATAAAEAGRAKQEMAALAKANTAAQQALKAKPTYPDLSGQVHELESEITGLKASAAASASELAAAQTAVTAGKQSAADLKAANEQIGQLKSAGKAKPAAPAYPDLSSKVQELESQTTALKTNLAGSASALATAQAAVAAGKQSAADLSAANEQIAQLKSTAATKAAAAYPDLSGKVHELEAQLAKAREPVSPAYPDLRSNVAALEAQLALANTAAQQAAAAKPAYPDLSGRVHELESQLAAANGQAEAATQTAVTASKQSVADLKAANEQIGQLKSAVAAQPAAPAYPDLTGRVHELEAQVNDLQAAAKAKIPGDDPKLRRERDVLSVRVSELTTETTQLRADRERMQKMLADAGKQMRDTTADAGRIKELETQVSSLQAAKPSAPAYPDLSDRVRELEAQVASAPKGRTTAYPNLAGRVVELETALADTKRQLADSEAAVHSAAAVKPAPAAPEADVAELQKRLAGAEDKLAISLRGYAALQRDREALAASTSKATEAVTAEHSSLAARATDAETRASAAQAEVARVNESLTALQHSTGQNTNNLAAARTLIQQLQGANAVLAGENYQLKTMLSRTTPASGQVNAAPVPAAPTAPAARIHVVASGDSLARLSQRYYGTTARWQEILKANADKVGPNGLLRIGTELRIP